MLQLSRYLALVFAIDADAVLLGLIGCMVVVSAVGFLCALLALRSERPVVAE